MWELGSREKASRGSFPQGNHRSTLGWLVPWLPLVTLLSLGLRAGGSPCWLPHPGCSCRLFLMCRAMPVLPSWLALGCRAVLLLLLCQKELGAEQRGMLLQRGTAGHHPSQHHPGECTQLGLSSSLQALGSAGDHFKVLEQLFSHRQPHLSSLTLSHLSKDQPSLQAGSWRCCAHTVQTPSCSCRRTSPQGSSCMSSPLLGFPGAHSQHGGLPRGAETGWLQV